MLRGVELAYAADLLTFIEQVTHSAMTFVAGGQLPVEEAYPLVERTVLRLAQHPAMQEHRPPSWGYKPNTGKPRPRGTY